MSKALLVGTRDWASADWADSYYPEDLPEDWRFCYYSNQFRAVLVSWEVWCNIDSSGVEAWLEDSDPEFRFVLEISLEAFTGLTENQVKNLLVTIKLLGPQLGGVLLGLDKGSRDTGFYSGLGRLLSILEGQFPVCINDAESAIADELAVLASKYNAGFCWHADQGGLPDSHSFGSGGHFMVALSSEQDAGRQRKIMEDLVARAGDTHIAGLFFEGAQAIQSAQQARVIAELAGI